jgi:hypothetical protein
MGVIHSSSSDESEIRVIEEPNLGELFHERSPRYSYFYRSPALLFSKSVSALFVIPLPTKAYTPQAALATLWLDGIMNHMKIAIELNAAQSEQLQAIAAALGVAAEELAQAVVTDLINNGADDFEAAASRVLQKNRELYRRLS